MSGKHALLSPSAAHRWSLCAASIAASRDEPNGTSEDAASGTLTHSIAQYALPIMRDFLYCPAGTDPWLHFAVGTAHVVEGFKFTVDQDRLDRVLAYGQAVLREPGTLLVEQHLDLSQQLGIPDQGGTGDAITLNYEESMIVVGDLKDGAGIVYAKGNKQLMLYGAAALHDYDMLHKWEKVKVCIHQPRMDHYDEWIYTAQELREFITEIAPVANFAYDLYQHGTAAQIRSAMVPGETQCRWCPIRAKCPARAQAIMDLFPIEEAEETIDVKLLGDIEIATALGRLAEIENWCHDIRSEATKRAMAGIQLLGFKLARGRKGPRAWTDLPKAEGLLPLLLPEDQCYQPRKIISPTEAEKRLKKVGADIEVLAPLIGQSDGALSVVPESDERPAVTVAPVVFPVAEAQV